MKLTEQVDKVIWGVSKRAKEVLDAAGYSNWKSVLIIAADIDAVERKGLTKQGLLADRLPFGEEGDVRAAWEEYADAVVAAAEANAVGRFYPPGWPACPGCGLPAMDGHITCGKVECDEGGRR